MASHARWALLALLPLAACNTNTTNPMGSTVPMPAPAVAGTGTQDQNFILQASENGGFEVASARLAVERARRPAVRAYAQRLLDAHTARTERLVALAGQKGVSVPGGLEPVQERAFADLRDNTRNFDQAFVAAQIESHQRAITTFQAEADNGRDPDVRNFAQQGLPDLRSHLAMAQRLRGGR